MLPTTLQRASRPTFFGPIDFFDRDFDRAVRQFWGDQANTPSVGNYPVDIHEDENHIVVEAEVPGFQKEDIHITLENGVLSIVAERKETEKKGESHLKERRFTRVARSFNLPTTVDDNKVEAKLDQGVLHVTLHKRDEVKPRKISVS